MGSHKQTKRDALIAEFAQFMKQEYPSKLGYDYPKFWGEKVAQAGVAVSISTTLSLSLHTQGIPSPRFYPALSKGATFAPSTKYPLATPATTASSVVLSVPHAERGPTFLPPPLPSPPLPLQHDKRDKRVYNLYRNRQIKF